MSDAFLSDRVLQLNCITQYVLLKPIPPLTLCFTFSHEVNL